MNPLTPNAIEKISKTQSQEDLTEVVVQILSIKKVEASQGKTERYRVVVSDGKYYMQAMIATQLNDLIASGRVGRNTVIRLQKYIPNNIGSKVILILLGFEPLDYNGEKIGDPLPVESLGGAAPQEPSNSSSSNQTRTNPVNVNANRASNPTPAKMPMQAPKTANQTPGVVPISSVNPFRNKWTIKARVISKGEIKTWKNAKGEGRLFSVAFSDQSGEIRATGFKEAVDQFYDLLEENQVYYVSGCALKSANKQFSNVKNEYEMTIDQNSTIVLCNDGDVPQLKLDAVEIAKIADMEPGKIVDVVAIVKEMSDVVEITTKAQKQLNKRDLTLVDMSGGSIKMTLWGKQAEEFNHSNAPVLAIKGAKIGDFGGRSLNAGFDTYLQANPDLPVAHTLRGWYDSQGQNMEFTTFSRNSAGGPSASKTIRQVNEENLGTTEKSDYYSLEASVTHIRKENFCYPACPTTGCNKKVIEMSNEWRCEKCDASFPAPSYRYILSASVSDFTGQIWVQCFNDQAEKILGLSAGELHNLKETNDTEFNNVISDAMFVPLQMKMRCKSEHYQDELKVRHSVMEVNKVDYPKRNLELIRLIDCV